ncbi:hypothetical protein JOC94_004321 [Bacillus thermophilus]|uniref:Uncharacterized protein n=1 Tax=Siminovitchia thermophila TaxID=1245522 RepID=A0ABS2RCA9_9BACI|nr:hypothetical protein [Siminovitchia thermophila]MBM7717296.1 hypothetical protein [Siminovitchia thermophila]ONK24292.1 hypothetical protein BLX87_06090 [Bacillus sp. VT-16-64]
MESDILDPIKDKLDNILIQVVSWLGFAVLAYAIVFMVLRLIKVPKIISNVIAVIVFAFVIYKTLITTYMPGIIKG